MPFKLQNNESYSASYKLKTKKNIRLIIGNFIDYAVLILWIEIRGKSLKLLTEKKIKKLIGFKEIFLRITLIRKSHTLSLDIDGNSLN